LSKGRLEAFSDGVLAIIITIMVLELHQPADTTLPGLVHVLPHVFLYLLSFVYLGIYWNNHHHLLQATRSVNGAVLWANLHLLFWLSLIPFTTAYMGHGHLAPLPIAVYGVNLLLAAVAYTILQAALINHHGAESPLKHAIGSDVKGKLSLASYALAIGAAFFQPWAALALYVFVAAIWLVPDRRIERELVEH
jgi:uncharacterized membrane protein